jgi:hypothetical protein
MAAFLKRIDAEKKMAAKITTENRPAGHDLPNLQATDRNVANCAI